MKDAVIVEALRAPIGRGHAEKGSLRGWHPVNLYAHAINALLARTGIDPAKVESLITGCVTARGEQGNNVSRLAGLLSNLPDTTDAFTVIRACGSSQEAVHLAALKVLAGDADYVIAGGVESMGRVPMFSDIGTPDNVNPDLKLKVDIIHQGESAERLCDIHGLTQDDLDRFAVESHRRAWAAQQAGFFRSQIAPLTGLDAAGNAVTIDFDEGIRESVDPAKMATLPRPFRPGVGKISAANASQIADGAGVLLIADRATAERDGFRPRARILARACAAGDPTLALMEVIPATMQAVQRAGLTLADIDLFEINEAFAMVSMLAMAGCNLPHDKVNVNGGACALGHPLGASGARILVTLIHALHARSLKRGVASLCIGGGEATAVAIELS